MWNLNYNKFNKKLLRKEKDELLCKLIKIT